MITKEISKDLVIGNLATEEAVKDVVSEIDKIDGFRVGLGGGSICITPEVTGVYMPTLYAVAEVRDAVDKLNMNVPVIADGGIRSSADIMRALAAGASSVMLGYMLAGTEEASAPKIRVGGSVYKPYRGMASISAIELRYAVDRYSRRTKQVAEGIEGLVPYKGSVYKIVQEIIEALKAGFGYAGASNIEELWRKTVFIRTKPRDSRDIIQKI
jgi:IMP dehydrogenase